MIKDIFSKIKYFLGLVFLLAIIGSGSNAPQNSDFSVKDQASLIEQNPGQLQAEKASQILNEIVPKETQTQDQTETKPQPSAPIQPKSTLSNDNYYTNVDGNTVHSPAYSTEPNTVPAGASAICRDGTYSFSQNRRGTCSHHGGVAEWL